MLSVLQQIIPSMFHRRLLLLGLLVLSLMVLLAAKTAHLTTGQEHLDRQETIRNSLERSVPTPTSRGQIRDRKDRLLAGDRPGWDVAVSFDLLCGNWAYTKAREAAMQSVGRRAWREMGLVQQDELASEFADPYRVKIESLKIALAEIGQVPIEELEETQNGIVEWVQRMVGSATGRKRAKRESDDVKVLKQSQDDDLSWADIYVEVIEQYQSHAVLSDVSDETVSKINHFRDRAVQEQARYEDAIQHAKDNELPPPIDNREYEAWLEVTPQRVRKRTYPWESRTFMFDRSTLPGPLGNDRPLEVTVDGIGRHIIGTLRPIHAGDKLWHERPYSKRESEGGPRIIDLGGYRPNDPIGRFGIERWMESSLRGKRGERITLLDTGETRVVPPEVGEDIHLTIDIQLQMRIQAIMSHDPAIGLMRSQEWHKSGYPSEKKPKIPVPGEKLNGAAVVIDIDNGEVLAAVSTPGVSFDQFEDKAKNVALYADQANQPYIFRPVSYAYDPGSTNKPLVLAAAITDGIIGPDQTIDCSQGYLWEGRPNTFRDWINKTNKTLNFGVLDGVQALTVSSNVFFGRLAQMFGEQMSYNRLAWWFYQYGFGLEADIGLDQVNRGIMPSIDESSPRYKPLTDSDVAYMSIGEGGLSATPLQVANAHATLARGGYYIPPTFVQQVAGEEPVRKAWDLNLSPAARDRALRGMYQSANERTRDYRQHGTTSDISFANGDREPNFTVPGVTVYAKSGTAEATPLRELDEQGRVKRTVNEEGKVIYGDIVREGNHAWVVALVQAEDELRPTHAIAVVVEYAGSGGRVSGPIVNQIVRALAVEGYLGPDVLTAVAASAAENGL